MVVTGALSQDCYGDERDNALGCIAGMRIVQKMGCCDCLSTRHTCTFRRTRSAGFSIGLSLTPEP